MTGSAECGRARQRGPAAPDLAALIRATMNIKDSAMPHPLDEARYALALANRIVAHEGVLDGFGHISLRHPTDANRYLLSRSRSPELIEPSDVLEFSLDSKLITP